MGKKARKVGLRHTEATSAEAEGPLVMARSWRDCGRTLSMAARAEMLW